jgi:hypothetical protein
MALFCKTTEYSAAALSAEFFHLAQTRTFCIYGFVEALRPQTKFGLQIVTFAEGPLI